MNFIKAYGKKPDHPGIICNDPSLTQQHMAEECDINKIMERYERTGQIDRLNSVRGFFGDVSQLYDRDYATIQDMVCEVECNFMELPAETRRKFDNDPRKMMTWLADPKNREEAVGLGLVNPPAKPDRNTELLEQIAKNTQNGGLKGKNEPSAPSST